MVRVLRTYYPTVVFVASVSPCFTDGPCRSDRFRRWRPSYAPSSSYLSGPTGHIHRSDSALSETSVRGAGAEYQHADATAADQGGAGPCSVQASSGSVEQARHSAVTRGRRSRHFVTRVRFHLTRRGAAR